jgi:hypothetical protein
MQFYPLATHSLGKSPIESRFFSVNIADMAGGRLSLVRAVLAIAALSLLCWAVLIALIVGLRAML